MKVKMKRWLGVLLSLMMVLGLMPGMSLTAYAADTTITWNDSDIPETYGKSFTKDGITMNVTGQLCDFDDKNFSGGTFMSTVGNFTKIEVTAMQLTNMGTGWTVSGGKATWTGTPSSTVNFGGSGFADGIWGMGNGVTMVFYFEGPSHTHSFTYSASGATITATCGAEGCDLTDSKATLTITAPTMTTYGGTGDAAATLTGLSDFNTATGKTIAATDIKYVGRGTTTYTESGTAPTDAGTYTAKITVEEKTASVDYEIAKADPTATAPSPTATYGQTLADVTLTNPEGNTAGAWAWAVATTTSVGSVGSHTFKADFTPTDTANYNSVSNVDVTVTVGKADNPANVTSTAPVTKGGNTVDLSDNVTLNGATGTVSYEISGEANGCSLSGSVLTSGDSTGTVTVNVTVAADDNYNALAEAPITVTISDKGTQTITASDVTVTYGDTGKSISASVTTPETGGGTLSYAVKSGEAVTVDESTGALTILKVGTAVITVTAAETSTYASATKDVTVTVNKANPTVTAPTAKTLTYTGQAQELVNAGSTEDGTLYYAVTTENTAPTDESLYTTSIPTGTDAGTYYVWYKVVGDDNHNDTTAQAVTVKIANAGVAAAKGIAKGKKSIKLSWNKVTGAASYEVWMARVGTKYKVKKVKILGSSKTSFTKKNLKKNTAYKFYVIVKDSSGNVISKSRLGRTITCNVRGKYTNAKKLKVSKTSVTLSKGGTAKIKATQTKARKSRKLYKPESTALLRYRSDNKAVATVDANGKITAAGTGTCRIYVQTVNGIWKTVEVTVK